MPRILGKVALITGAANGLGRATAEKFAAEGGRLLLTDIDKSGGLALAQELQDAGSEAHFMVHDVTSEAAWQAVFEHLMSLFGRLDVLVNNAGGGTYNDIESLSLAQWQQVISLNLDSTFIGTQLAVSHMKGQGGGSIINLSSVGGLVGSPNLVAYSAAKAGVKLLTKSVAIHCGQNNYGIRVNSVHPGLVRTESGIDMAAQATGLDAKAAEAAFSALHPIGRIGEANEIAEGILFLASDESSFMTGAELVIDGGFTAQ